MITIQSARFPQDLDAVKAIFREYIASVSVNLEFQDYETEFAALPGKYAQPDGCLLLAWKAAEVVGCVALRRFDAQICEIKRLYVRPQARGENAGRQLIEAVLQQARAAGYARACLDVLAEFQAAQRLYASLGFTETAAITFNPVPGTRFLGLDL
jgi:putative acetyltransferase